MTKTHELERHGSTLLSKAGFTFSSSFFFNFWPRASSATLLHNFSYNLNFQVNTTLRVKRIGKMLATLTDWLTLSFFCLIPWFFKKGFFLVDWSNKLTAATHVIGAQCLNFHFISENNFQTQFAFTSWSPLC